MAFLASSAFAQSVEVLEEDLGHCGEVVEDDAGHNTSGGCQVRATNAPGTSAVTFAHISGSGEVVTSSCQNVFVANINEDGVGHIDVDANTIAENEGTGCVIEPCDEAVGGTTPHADFEWPISGIAEFGASREEMVVTFCIRAHSATEGPVTSCTLEVNVTLEDPPTHQYEFRAVDEPCMENPIIELSGHWLTDETFNEVELRHIHYPGENP
ncbi:MAG TPA: hypothetical protein VNO82_15085 [Solirubrobacteraceae bacterium]|nr:hypothetical protein [Solirubrobacteraceae bacterium]